MAPAPAKCFYGGFGASTSRKEKTKRRPTLAKPGGDRDCCVYARERETRHLDADCRPTAVHAQSFWNSCLHLLSNIVASNKRAEIEN